MQKLTSQTLRGFIPSIVTPFTAQGEIMEDAFVHLVDHMIEIGAEVVCVAGDNGECWGLTLDEHQRLVQLAVERARKPVPVVMGFFAATTAQSIAYGKAAQGAGASGVLMTPQTAVLRASRDELLRRYEAFSRAVNLPIVAYNSSRRASFELSLSDLDALVQVAPIIGIKESSRDFFHHTHLIERFSKRISVLVGPSHYILPAAALGAQGFVATGPELLGKTVGRLIQVGREKPGAEYVEIHRKITLLYEVLMGVGTWPSSFKAALNLLGLSAGMPRDPILALEGPEFRKVEDALKACELLPR